MTAASLAISRRFSAVDAARPQCPALLLMARVCFNRFNQASVIPNSSLIHRATPASASASAASSVE